jgi:pilus assembly protein CpaF
MSALEAEVHRRLLEEGVPDPAVAGRIDRLVREAAPLLPAAEVAAVVARVRARVSGLGPLEPLLEDASVTDLLVNGPGPVWVDRGGRLQPTEVQLDRPAIDLLVERILAPIGRRVDPTSPVVDARLADGSRVHVVVPPLAVDGPCVAIRRFRTRQVRLDEVAPPSVAALLAWAVRARSNVVVSGATGSGKTTLLNALAAHVPAGERIVTIEDAAELRLPADHVVRLETRPGSVEGVVEVSCRDLVRSALRLRPDRIVVGEVRGGEALELVAAMNTGHDGSLSTVHANGCEDALRRLETLVLLAGVALPLEAVRDHLAAAVDLVVHIARGRDGRRKVVEVAEVCPPGARSGSGDRRATWLVADSSGVRRLPQRPPRDRSAGSPDPAWCSP